MTLIDALSRMLEACIRTFLKIAGVEPETLRHCPARDRDNALIIAFLMVLVWLWQTSALSLTMHMIADQGSAIRPDYIVASMLIATLVMTLDSYMIMRQSWYTAGLRELVRGGYPTTISAGDQIKSAVFVTVRLALAANIAILAGLDMLIMVFWKDLQDKGLRDLQSQNATQIEQAIQRDQAEATRLDTERTRVVTAYSALAATQRELEQSIANGGANDPESGALIERLSQIGKDKAAAEARLKEAQERAAHELDGTLTADTSGLVGDGPKARAARDRVRAAQAAVDAKDAEMARLQLRLDALRAATSAGKDGRLAIAQARLPTLLQEKAALDQALRDHDAKQQAWLADRDRRINEAINNDPMTTKSSHGFLAQVRALWALSSDPVIAVIGLMVFAFFCSLELAAILAKLTAVTPTTYARLIAADEMLRTAKIVEDLCRDVNALHQPANDDEQARPSDMIANDNVGSEDVSSEDDRQASGAILEGSGGKLDHVQAPDLTPPVPASVEPKSSIEQRDSTQDMTGGVIDDTLVSKLDAKDEHEKPADDSASASAVITSDAVAKPSDDNPLRALERDVERHVRERLADRTENDASVDGDNAPAKRSRGRPPGARNKPKGPWLLKNQKAS